MYKVVIVDDEHIIVEGLSKGIDWAKYNCEVVGTAGSGEEGMELIRELSPDILFTDICMGEMDGLTMVAGIRSEFPNLQVTILTGYRDFEYAQRAIRLGASRFLLKPSKMEELIEAIGGMTAKLDLIKPGVAPDEGDEETDAAASSYVVTRALNYMEKNYKEKLRLVDVAEKCFVSQWHLSKLLNKYEGIGFSDALNRIRVKKAEELLMDPTLRVSDIAEMVGFIDMAHFSRVFKKWAGCSANEYRNKQK
ncbi:Helix-turn-helix domain-containing protein [Lachnospiraceae bacterium G11]|nr:Helix-turn-helix domain-containing protein [Lachnospiraceae bacterium G11]